MPIKNEQGWERMAAYMILEGRTNKEIAAAANVTTAHITILRGQRWFQELLATLGKDMHTTVQKALEGGALQALENLVSLANESESDRVRLAANLALLEHAHGKAVQRIHSIHEKGTSFSSPQDEKANLLQQLEDLRNARKGIKVSDVEATSTDPNGAMPPRE